MRCTRMSRAGIVVLGLGALLAPACGGGEEDAGGPGNQATVAPPVTGDGMANNGNGAAGGEAGTGTLGMAGTSGAIEAMAGAGAFSMPPPGGSGAAGSAPPPVAGAPAPGGMGGGEAGAAGGSVGPNEPMTPAGPEDGDPGQPIVEAPGVRCGANPSLAGLTATNAMIGGRAVHVAYPCNKRKGAPVVFILNLHGTMPDETLKGYQVAYFAANNYVESHNLITVAPKSVVAQWGNGDNGADLPHLMEVIDWVYTTFADFDIRAMWVAGHSWGAMYTSTFACRPELADKVKGVVLQSGIGMNPACADRISVISSAAENDIGPVVAQGGVPASHGCGPEQTNMLGNNVETYWPDCDPGFTHANYLMLGKAHADYMDAVVVERIADLIKAARP